jgi:hypothetical protein
MKVRRRLTKSERLSIRGRELEACREDGRLRGREEAAKEFSIEASKRALQANIEALRALSDLGRAVAETIRLFADLGGVNFKGAGK